MPDIRSLKTRIKNTSGGILPISIIRNGMELAVDQEVDIIGSLTEAVAAGKGPSRAARALASLEALLVDGKIAVIFGPEPIVYDAVDDITKAVVIKDSAIVAKSPSWVPSVTSSTM